LSYRAQIMYCTYGYLMMMSSTDTT